MSNCYGFLSPNTLSGAKLLRFSSLLLGAAAFSGQVIFAQELREKFVVPDGLSSALGWKALPSEKTRDYGAPSPFVVGSDPSKWPAALELSKNWAAQSPSLDRAAGEYFFRKLTRIESLALGANDAAVVTALHAERKALGEAIVRLRNLKSRGESNEWEKRSLVNALQLANQELGGWLADSPADRVQLFRELVKDNQPISRVQLAERYGGEDRLVKLIELAKDYNRLAAEQRDVYHLPQSEQREASAKASEAMSRFYAENTRDMKWEAVRDDPDLAIELGGGNSSSAVEVPADLLVWAGEAETMDLLGAAYALRVPVNLTAESRTGVLARRLIIDGKVHPVSVPWSLVGWPEDAVTEKNAKDLVSFYDVLKLRFNLTDKISGNNWSQNNARAMLALALASVDRMDEAVVLAGAAGGRLGLPYRARIAPKMADAAWDLTVRLSTANDAKNADRWEDMQRLAQVGNRRGELVAFAKKKVTDTEANPVESRLWRERLGWALIATDKLDDGLALLIAALGEGYQQRGNSKDVRKWSASLSRLFLLAKGLNRPELVAPWQERLAQEFKKPKSALWEEQSLFDTFAEAQIAAGNSASLEALLRARTAPRPSSKRPLILALMDMRADEEDRTDYSSSVIWLADVLGRSGKHAEVVTLLADSPYWSNADLAGYISDSGSSGRPLPLIAADSLNAVGRTDEAVAIIEAYLAANIGYDPAYALYTRIQGDKAVPFLEKLREADRFEERPLIWLASLSLSAGDVEGAERTVKQAIAIDPSDGEQPKGDRMRAYAVLRDVALKKGDAAQAEFLSGVLAAIRRSENADDLVAAGLVDRAIEEYQLALESFSDAYCIQSRLARQLAEENRLDEAVEHYKRAFELMPDSFGRVESHCFGCERAFAGERAQSVAERVFTEMAAKPDAKPQVQYLLGYLRLEQGRWEEAAEHFNKATVADPEYLNAWKKLFEVLPRTSRPRVEQDRVAFRLLELDPLGKHVGGDLAVRDLPSLWRHYEKAGDVLPPTPEKLFPIGKKEAKASSGYSLRSRFNEPNMAAVPERFARHRTLSAITLALDASYQWMLDPN